MLNLNSKIKKITAIPINIAFKKVIFSLFKKYIKAKKFRKLEAFEKNLTISPIPNFNFKELNVLKFRIFQDLKPEFLNKKYIENIIAHKFDILGTGLISVNIKENGNENNINNDYQKINWHKDFKSGFEWSQDLDCFQIKIGNEKGVDIKIPWELSRLHHFVHLALWIYLEKPDKVDFILREYENQLDDYIDSNQYLKGVNWVSPMEVSIRSINIIISLSLINEKGILISEPLMKKVQKYLYFSGHYIYLYREWSSGLRNNHYFANLLGLLFISKCFPENHDMNQIFDFSKKEFFKEINWQFNNEGSNFEGSIPYHFFMVEMIYYGFEILQFDIKSNLDKVINKLNNIIIFSNSIFGNNNFYPQIGDNDSGKILNMNELDNTSDIYSYPKKILTYINDLLSLYYDDYNINKQSDKNINMNIFKEIGLVVYKNKKIQLWISLGRKSQKGKGGHNHYDSSSFVLQINDKEYFVDPGTYLYTSEPEIRNIFRSAQYHNNYFAQDMEHIEQTKPEDLFWLNDKICEYSVNKDKNYIILKIIRKIKNNIINRTFHINSDEISITDELNRVDDAGVISFHLNPKIEDILIKDNIIIIENKVSLSFSENLDFKISDYSFSPVYGKILPAKKIIFSNLTSINNFKIKIL